MKKKTKPEEKKLEENEESAIVKDQTERSYYYDDACGYEVYIEEETDNATDHLSRIPTRVDDSK